MAEQADKSKQSSNADILSAVLGAKQPAPEPESSSSDVANESEEQEQEDQSPESGTDEEVEPDQEIDLDETSDDEPEDDNEPDDLESESEDDTEAEYIDIRDDDIIPVMVDGEEREATIGELKKALSGEGAIEKRLQEATELRKAAIAERTSWLENQAANERLINEVFDGLDDSVFKAVIPPPPAELKQSDPQRYLRHQEAYEQDQKRIKEAKDAINNKRTELEQHRQERLQQYARQAAQVIEREIPELADPKTANGMFKRMAETAMNYGYTADEINNALDPRMFMLVRDAMRYREMSSKAAERNPKDLEPQKQKKVRRLRSGNTQAKSRVRRADQNYRAAVKKAKETGKPDDVAATLFKPKR